MRLQYYVGLGEEVLVSEGTRPHFRSAGGWLPWYVTALEDVQGEEVGRVVAGVSFPCGLSDAQRVALSVIEEHKRSQIAGEIRLAYD